jgi:hypothetical protein
MAVLYLDTKHSIGEGFQNRALYFYGIFFSHILTNLSVGA